MYTTLAIAMIDQTIGNLNFKMFSTLMFGIQAPLYSPNILFYSAYGKIPQHVQPFWASYIGSLLQLICVLSVNCKRVYI